jgi:tetratricopeptide (TPR) repeat protein
MREPRILHCTSEPYRFFGRTAELALLQDGLNGGAASVVALIGPGGQGKTATIQHWLDELRRVPPDGLFFWSFYRGKDADLCLRELHAYATGTTTGDVATSWCVDQLLPLLLRERWAIVLDGLEVVQHETGPWFGRPVHPELARLIEELASAPQLGVLVLTSRFPLPGLEVRRHARVIQLVELDDASARGLLRSLGVVGTDDDLTDAARACRNHAKAVELLGTLLVRHESARGERWRFVLPPTESADAEQRVARVLAGFQARLPTEQQDLLALATAFRTPPTEQQLLEYLRSEPVRSLLHSVWQRTYEPFAIRRADSLRQQLDELIQLRLLERVAGGTGAGMVIDAHPLVRRAFEHLRGPLGRQENALARAGFLRSRPDRRRPETLEEARAEVELFHAHCDAGLWNEADSVITALENPKHRFLAPAFERDLLLRFFPEGDWRQPPLWPGFGRYRSLALCFEMLGQYKEALEAYPDVDAPLRGDALLALGQLEPLLQQPHAPPPWQPLWSAYRAHALSLAGRLDEALALARSLVPVDIYEWVHVFECLLRADRLDLLDLKSVLFRPPFAAEHRWAELARRRMQADYERVLRRVDPVELLPKYRELIEAYDRAGLPYERCLTRLGCIRLSECMGREDEAREQRATVRELSERFGVQLNEAMRK